MPRFSFLLVLPLLAGLGAVTGTAATSPPAKTIGVQPPHAAVSDAQLDAAIHTKLAKSKIGKDGFRYHVQHGIVTWEGVTAVGQHKGAATRMARTSGAAQVVNNIKVNSAGKGGSATLRKAYVQP